jgi:putative ABC transport system permease protein
MLKNYLVVAVRNFLRQRLFSFINVAGLAAGLACSLFIFLWVSDELKKDRFHANIDQIYHIVYNIYNPEGTITWTNTPGPLADEIKNNIPEIEYVAPIADDGPRLIQVDDKSFLPDGYFTYPEFFKIFSYKIIEGDAGNPLADPNSIVLTKSLAQKLFGNEPAVGKPVKLRVDYDLKVSAVMEDVPNESSLQFEFIAHFDVHKKNRPQSWSNSDYPLFLKFRDQHFNASETQAKIHNHLVKVLEVSEEGSKSFLFYLQPFADRYLYASFENGFPVSGRIKYVKIFTIVAIFILVVACINFMNLATARAAIRHKEIGMRKVIGAQRWVLITQFISESILIAALSMIIAVLVVEVSLPLFNTLVSKQIIIQYSQPQFYLPVILIVLITGMLSGSYPAFILSKVNPVKALKGGSVTATQGASLRKALVVFQFVISVVLIVSSLVVFKQIEFIQSKNMGYNKENVMIIPGRGVSNYELFKNKLSELPGVSSVALANQNIIQVQNQNSSFNWEGKPEDNRIYVRTLVVGYDFIETMGLNVVEGRSFKPEHNDTSNVIINQKMASLMNVDDPIGIKTDQWGAQGKIVGVVEDFHIRSMSESMDPIVILCRPDWTGRVYVRVEATKIQETISKIEQEWKTASPNFPFEYAFLDEAFGKLYKEEQVISKLSVGFTFMAVLISALGLLGLAAYSTERKKKEISIRKVLGATVPNLIMLMSTEFLVLTAIALLVGCPAAYYLMNEFLQGYAYHVSIHYSVFVTTAIGLLFVTLFVILFQVSRAALTNPVDNLRNE